MWEDRYDYAGPYPSMELADEALEQMLDEGTVCEGERPDIETRHIRREGKRVTRFYITLRGN